MLYADRVQETTTTAGTGNITLAGAASGYISFNTAFGVGPKFSYGIVDGAAWEIGYGHLSGSTTLVRDTILKSSNSNNVISLSGGTATIFCSVDAEAFSRNRRSAAFMISRFFS
jgi:hypothetical protein